MLTKTSAGLLRFPLAICLAWVCMAAWGTGGYAQGVPFDPRPSPGVESTVPGLVAPSAPVPGADVPESAVAAPAPEAEVVPRLPASERLEALKSADLETLKAAQADCLKAAGELGEKVPILRQEISVAYEDARLNSPEAKALQQQIRELEAKLEQTLREAPAVKEKLQAVEQAQKDMFAELQLRTKLAGLIAAKENAAPAPDAAPAAISE